MIKNKYYILFANVKYFIYNLYYYIYLHTNICIYNIIIYIIYILYIVIYCQEEKIMKKRKKLERKAPL